jgi:hypothetical protein
MATMAGVGGGKVFDDPNESWRSINGVGTGANTSAGLAVNRWTFVVESVGVGAAAAVAVEVVPSFESPSAAATISLISCSDKPLDCAIPSKRVSFAHAEDDDGIPPNNDKPNTPLSSNVENPTSSNAGSQPNPPNPANDANMLDDDDGCGTSDWSYARLAVVFGWTSVCAVICGNMSPTTNPSISGLEKSLTS